MALLVGGCGEGASKTEPEREAKPTAATRSTPALRVVEDPGPGKMYEFCGRAVEAFQELDEESIQQAASGQIEKMEFTERKSVAVVVANKRCWPPEAVKMARELLSLEPGEYLPKELRDVYPQCHQIFSDSIVLVNTAAGRLDSGDKVGAERMAKGFTALHKKNSFCFDKSAVESAERQYKEAPRYN